MCGIAGYVGTRPLPPDAAARTLAQMEHRGPDGAGQRAFETPDGRHVTLLHTRLKIIDLDARANQPFHLGGYWLIYNGELFNYIEVRAELAARGVGFGTESDTEVLAAVLEHLGWQGLDRCEGMWAFAAYDERTSTLSLCRDRFGEKPLYLHRGVYGELYFGSEVKFISAMLGGRLPVSHAHLRRYLVNGYKALYKTPETFFLGLTELPAGSVLHLGRDGYGESERYWSRPLVPTPDGADMSYDEAVAGVRARLIRAVEMRLRADVPLAFSMSGGVDSLSLISIARRVLGFDVHGFTIVNSDARYEEQEMVDHAVAELGLRHTAIPLESRDFLPRLRDLVRHHDAPVYTVTYFVQWLLMGQVAEHGYRVSISGTAADELFSGYYDHHLAYLRDVHADRELFDRSVAAWREHVAPQVRNPFLRDPWYFIEDPSRRDHIYLDAGEFASYLTDPFTEPFAEASLSDDLLRNRMLNELFSEAVPVILHEDDLNAMAFSIENRSPFLDRELFEYSAAIPTRHLVRDGRAKAVLRDAMQGIAPLRALENRRKVGFNAPILSLLDTSNPEVRRELLEDSPVWEHVRREAIERMLDQRELPNSKSKFLFNFLNVKLFLEEQAA